MIDFIQSTLTTVPTQEVLFLLLLLLHSLFLLLLPSFFFFFLLFSSSSSSIGQLYTHVCTTKCQWKLINKRWRKKCYKWVDIQMRHFLESKQIWWMYCPIKTMWLHIICVINFVFWNYHLSVVWNCYFKNCIYIFRKWRDSWKVAKG